MASVASLIRFNPVRQHTPICLPRTAACKLRIEFSLPRTAACKLRIEFSRRIIKHKRLVVKCIEKRDPPFSSFSSYDDVQKVFRNRHLDAVNNMISLNLVFTLESWAVLIRCFFMYRFRVSFGVLAYFLFVAGSVSLLFAFAWCVDYFPWMIHEKTASVIKLQVGLLGMGSSLIQKKLNRITEVVDASTCKGTCKCLNYVSTEVSMALLRHIDYCISGYASVDVKMSVTGWKKRFKLLSIEERGKLDVKNIWKPSPSGRSFSGSSKEDIGVTILIAVQGLHELPFISKPTDLKEALQKVASILAGHTLAVEVFWAPQNENDVLLEQCLLQDYPLLKRL